ncbi:hypothetical protein VTK73DRAFT_5591 [Phialemonium thermophilum]|uniref:Uncharacterized protein n=1 Tax=Phialemonium thermophilum TaxID=223376 RepID=A0ABR3WNE3_9PEZI
MWLRDSASQIYSYLPLLQPSSDPDSLASLWRGVINSHSRYITISPYCHSFQPPVESGLKPTSNLAQNNPQPPFNSLQVYDCKWELDSLASFLQISSAYYSATGDLEFFSRYRWVEAVAEAVKAAGDMRRGTYDTVGRVQPSAYTFTGWTNRGSETLTNNGLGNPTRANGMVRTAFRPSDDACIFQFLTPANMMWAKYLEEASIIMEKLARRSNPGQGSRNSYLTLNDSDPTITPADAIPSLNELVVEMRAQAAGIRRGIDRDAVVWHRDFGHIFAYEVDGFGGVNLMDDANVPSLLAMPLWNYSRSSFFDLLTNKVGNGVSSATVKDASEIEAESRAAEADRDDQRDYDLIYRNTRSFILSEANPYFATGPVISAVGGAHLGPGMAWPMAAIVAALTAYEPAVGPLLSRHDRETTDMRPDNDYDSMDVSDQEEDYRPVATELDKAMVWMGQRALWRADPED